MKYLNLLLALTLISTLGAAQGFDSDAFVLNELKPAFNANAEEFPQYALDVVADKTVNLDVSDGAEYTIQFKGEMIESIEKGASENSQLTIIASSSVLSDAFSSNAPVVAVVDAWKTGEIKVQTEDAILNVFLSLALFVAGIMYGFS